MLLKDTQAYRSSSGFPMLPHHSCPEPAFDESFYIPSPDPLTFLENYKLFSKTSFKYYYYDRLRVFPGFFCFKLHVYMYVYVCVHACMCDVHTYHVRMSEENLKLFLTFHLNWNISLLVTIIYVKITAQWSSKISLDSVSKLPVGGILG